MEQFANELETYSPFPKRLLAKRNEATAGNAYKPGRTYSIMDPRDSNERKDIEAVDNQS